MKHSPQTATGAEKMLVRIIPERPKGARGYFVIFSIAFIRAMLYNIAMNPALPKKIKVRFRMAG
jgi:hypothetical protein